MFEKKINVVQWLRDNLLLCIIAVQPLLDVLAYWTQGGNATVAGYIRLAIMLALPVYVFITDKRRISFALLMAAIGLVCGLHVLNAYKIGYISISFDISYLAKMVQAPVLAICFCRLITDEKAKDKAIKGIVIAAIITLAALLIALLTGTWNSTYTGGTGLSGWVIDDNRCANSIIFVSLSSFAVYIAAVSKRKLINIGLPALVCFLLIANGTKACYLALFVFLVAYAAFMIFSRIVIGEKIKPFFLVTLIVLFVISIVVYPISPRALVDRTVSSSAVMRQGQIDGKLAEMGYDAKTMTFEEKFNNPEVRAVFEEYYMATIGFVMPDIFDRFGAEKVFAYYDMTTDAERIIDTRVMKRAYAALTWDEVDSSARIAGMQPAEICLNGSYDLENDYHAIFYYLGYLGFALYVLYLLYFIFIVIKRLVKDFKGSVNMLNFCLLLTMLLQLGLAHFSGAVLKRPNVSVYLAVIQALIYYRCEKTPVVKVEDIQA